MDKIAPFFEKAAQTRNRKTKINQKELLQMNVIKKYWPEGVERHPFFIRTLTGSFALALSLSGFLGSFVSISRTKYGRNGLMRRIIKVLLCAGLHIYR